MGAESGCRLLASPMRYKNSSLTQCVVSLDKVLVKPNNKTALSNSVRDCIFGSVRISQSTAQLWIVVHYC